MGALYASAQWDEDDPRPNFFRVSENVGIPRMNLTRWWTGRDKAVDAQKRAEATRAAEADFAAGVIGWRHAVVELADFSRRMIDHGRQYLDKATPDEPIPPRDMADISKAAAPCITGLQKAGLWMGAYSLGEKDGGAPAGGRGGDDPGDVADRVRSALVRSVTPNE